MRGNGLINRITMGLASLVMTLAFSACRTELCYDHFSQVDLSFEWEHEWERDYGMAHADNWDFDRYGYDYDEFRPGLPEWINTARFVGDEVPVEKSFMPEGGSMMVEGRGRESLLLYNGDTEYLIFSDIASLNEARASATSRSRGSLDAVLTSDYPDSRSTNPPDILYAAFIEKLPEVEVHEKKPLTVTMQPLVYTYLVRYEFEYGLEYVAMTRGALAGMAESVYLRDGSTSENKAIVLFDCDMTHFGCESRVRSFGLPGLSDAHYGRRVAEAETPKVTLNLEVLLTNGHVVEFNFDISDQMANQPRGGVITVRGIRIDDKDIATGSGFDVKLNDWGNHENIDLPVGAS